MIQIDVAVTIIRVNERLFVRRRRGTGHLDGLWEFPGGKIQEKESPVHAAQRELLEEVGVEFPSAPSLLEVLNFRYPRRRVRIHFFLVDLPQAPIDLSTKGAWFTPKQLLSLGVPPANRSVLKMLMSAGEAESIL
jgi:8-oxo-dGTP diphosphatase